MRRSFIISVYLLFLFLLFSCSSQHQPNFVFILVDDLGWADVQCNNPECFYDTPNINRLAKGGILFSNAYAACPVCSPTRASIMTGRYPERIPITDWIPGMDPKDRKLLGPADKHELPLEELTIAERLKEAGYSTGFFGKWHLGGEGFLPEDQGFDVNVGGYHRGSPPGGYYSPYKNPKLANGPDGEYLPDRLTEEAILFIEENKEKPFFVFLAYYIVHTPIQACERYLSKYIRKKENLVKPDTIEFIREGRGYTKMHQDNSEYASMVYAMDENVGRMIDLIESLGINGKTYIFFTSDNGGLSTLAGKNSPTSNKPLRAGKGWCYEGGIRVPLIIYGPGIVESGSTCEYPVISNDFYHTILDLTGLDYDKNESEDGISMVPMLKNKELIFNREDLFWHFPHYHGSTWAPGSAMRSGDWKLIRFYEEEHSELYNLSDDTGEKINLYDSIPGKAKEMELKLDRWLKDVDARMPVPNSNCQSTPDCQIGGK